MTTNLDMRLVRHFVAVAEELHFGRAAARLYVAQQVVSRDVRKLEDQLGLRLFDRSSRNVTLSVAGETFLTGARALLASHDELLGTLRGAATRVVVDAVGNGTAPARLLLAARSLEDDFEYYSVYESGLVSALSRLAAHTLDVGFGRLGELTLPPGVQHRLVGHEPLAILLPAGHDLAEAGPLPMAALRGLSICWQAGDQVTAEWEDAALQLLRSYGAQPVAAHPRVRGIDELAHHLRPGEPPVLTLAGQAQVPGAVLRPLIDPRPLYPWSMFWRAGWRHPGLDVLHQLADERPSIEGWPAPGDDTWLPLTSRPSG
ncbi:LysR family transcriptional regulator [Kribbella italica]|uniref:DNA-binding transcriptional LysR family regulator n=1 Tax=Kribbella italica TaxID=1540520 RepID=A0A7W9J505_9ACTN|nr:LysR family transcriptional regulator [Kribbella italica]MBB5835714.1 DNA-binding transcriptional LysR family regulator [Kribbella italica]